MEWEYGAGIEISVSFVLGFGFGYAECVQVRIALGLTPHMIPKHAMDLLRSCICIRIYLRFSSASAYAP
jgi:hypothetical protein